MFGAEQEGTKGMNVWTGLGNLFGTTIKQSGVLDDKAPPPAKPGVPVWVWWAAGGVGILAVGGLLLTGGKGRR